MSAEERLAFFRERYSARLFGFGLSYKQRCGSAIVIIRANRAELTVSASSEQCDLHEIAKDGIAR
jgi:hypothetical protein